MRHSLRKENAMTDPQEDELYDLLTATVSASQSVARTQAEHTDSSLSYDSAHLAGEEMRQALDAVVRFVLARVEERVKEVETAVNRAANTASCLANGIIPD